MAFPEKPDVLKDLTPLEERLISPRIPFMQVRELPSGGQLSIHGNVVNVPADVNSTVSVLPRPINESQTIPIKNDDWDKNTIINFRMLDLRKF